MKSPLFSINDIAAEAKNNREEMKKQRRHIYTYHTRLSNDIMPFKKRNMKQMKTKRKQFPRNDMYLELKYFSAYTKSLIVNEEIVSVNNSQQQIDQPELINLNLEALQDKEVDDESTDESTDELYFHQNTPFSPNDSDVSDSIDMNDEYPEAALIDEGERELHRFTYISANNAMLEFLKLIRQSQISKKESEHFLSFIKSILPFPNEMPKNMNTLLKRLDVIDYFNKRTICVLCGKEFQKNQNLCDKCIKPEKKYVAHILDTDIYALLSDVVSRLAPDIEEYKNIIVNPDPQTPYDIPFAKLYQHLLQQNPNKNLLTLLLHIDGISLVKSTKLKLWICDASIVELPPNLRNRRSNMFLISMYIGYIDPNAKLWLKSCFSTLSLLKATAFEVHGVQKTFTIKIYGCIADCPALKIMANIIGHNGYHPCFYCFNRGEHIRAVRKRQYQYDPNIAYRTARTFYLNSTKAELTNENIFGHLGISILDEVADVPLPRALIIDYAHVSLLRHFRDIIQTIASSLKPSLRKKIDQSLREQVFPHFFHRKMRGIMDFSFIKAVEWKNLLLYGFIPHFMHHLTTNQLSFMCLLIIGLRLIHADNIFTSRTSTISKQLLCKYYADHHLFFSYHANFVLHLHQHLHEVYEFHGPLSSINTLAQEDFIGYIKKNKNGTTSFENLFAYYYNIDILLKKFNENNNCLAEGPLDLFVLEKNDPLFSELFNHHQKICRCNYYFKCIKTFRRCFIYKKMFHSLKYLKRKNTMSYFVQYLFHRDQLEFGIIKIFFKYQGQTYALLENFQVINAFSDYIKESHYYELLKEAINHFYFVLKKTNVSRIILVEKIQKHAIIFKDIIEKSLVLATVVSTITEHD